MSPIPEFLDGSLYPDMEPPPAPWSLSDCVDYLARLCASWDFGVLPDPRTVEELRRPEWREAVDACRLLTSPVYHLLRKWHGLPPLPYLGAKQTYILDDPQLEHV
jgi:hypothetical protein